MCGSILFVIAGEVLRFIYLFIYLGVKSVRCDDHLHHGNRRTPHHPLLRLQPLYLRYLNMMGEETAVIFTASARIVSFKASKALFLEAERFFPSSNSEQRPLEDVFSENETHILTGR